METTETNVYEVSVLYWVWGHLRSERIIWFLESEKGQCSGQQHQNLFQNRLRLDIKVSSEIRNFQKILYKFLALNDGEYEVALKCANDANKAIDGHTKKTAHILTLQADSNSLHG